MTRKTPDYTAETAGGFFGRMSWDDVRHGIAGLDPKRRAQLLTRALPGDALPAGTSVEQALPLGGADFTVGKRPLQAVVGKAADGSQIRVDVPGKVVLVREDSNKPLGVTSDSYGVIQNTEAFAGAAALAKTDGEFQPAAVQVLGGGEKVRLSCLIGESTLQRADGRPDVLGHFAQFETSHNGTGSALGKLFTLRLICFNGMTTAETVASYSVRHTANAVDRLAEAQAVLLGIREAAVRETELFQRLAYRRMSREEYVRFAARLLDEERGELTEESTARSRSIRESDLADLLSFFEGGQGNTGETAWDGFNGVSEWIDHRRAKLAETREQFAKRFESANSGSGARTKARALRLLTRG